MADREFGRREWFKRTAAMAGAGVVGAAAGGRTADAAVGRLAADTGGLVPRKTLGTTGAEIPVLLMGCSQRFDPQYDTTLHRAFKAGVNYLDTAQTYAAGQSHKTLAPFIKQVGRENLWITSKVAANGKTVEPDLYRRYLEESVLPDLQVDSLDMFFMHAVSETRQLSPEFVQMGEDVKKAGLARFFGFSCHMGNVVELLSTAARIGAPGIDAIMFRYNFTMYGDLELNKAIDACKNAGIGLIAMKTQASVPEDREEVRQFTSEDWTLPQAKLKAVWADDRIDAAVSEMSNTQQVEENTRAAVSTQPLAMREFMQLNRYAARTAASRCQGCSHICESRVPGGLRIADTLRFLMYAECYGKLDRARELYQALPSAERDFALVDLREAAASCPQGVDIARRLVEAQRLLA